MKTKTKQLLLGILALVLILGGGYFFLNQNKDTSSKKINLEILVEDQSIYHDTVKTNAHTLGDLLMELDEQGTLDIDYESGEYGMFITGINDHNQDESKGLYWTYDSKDNSKCKADGYCSAADMLPIEDGNHFTFSLASYE